MTLNNCNDFQLFSSNNLLINKSECLYTSCYCEENIWKLCEEISKSNEKHLINCFVVFISNNKKMVPLWKQRSGNPDNDHLSVWDYHVIMIYSNNDSNAQVFDFDSQLSFPSDYDLYSKLTFRDENSIKKEFHRLFRVISAELYLKKFASNRSHMRRPDGSWIMTPPNYPSIKTNDCDNNLEGFISMDINQFDIGFILNLKQINERFSGLRDEESD